MARTLAYKYKMYPTKSQETLLLSWLETHRRIYNWCIDEWETAYREKRGKVTWQALGKQFTELRKTNPFYASINHAAGKRTIRKFGQTVAAFFERIKKRPPGTKKKKWGRPRFKKREIYNTFAYTYKDGCHLIGESGRRVGNGRVQFSYRDENGKVQTIAIKVRFYRPIPESASIQAATVTRGTDGWSVSFSVREPEPSAITCGSGAVGIDLGMTRFVATSDGEELGFSKYLHRAFLYLRGLDRRIQRAKNRNLDYSRLKRKRAWVHGKIARRRREMQREVARELVNRYAVIVLEDLSIRSLLQSKDAREQIGFWNRKRAIYDAAWYQFRQFLQQAGEATGAKIVVISPTNTTKECSRCGFVGPKKDLDVRKHKCLSCGLVMDRDYNAAKVILARGLEKLAGTPPGAQCQVNGMDHSGVHEPGSDGFETRSTIGVHPSDEGIYACRLSD